MKERNEVCKCCMFWDGYRLGNDEGNCHAGPPQCAGVVPQQNPITGQVGAAVITSWPRTAPNAWCGFWSADDTNVVELLS